MGITFDRDKAIAQYDHYVKDFQKTIKNFPEFEQLAEVILDLRKYDFSKKYELLMTLCYTENGSFLNDFRIALDSGRDMELPETLERLLSRLEYNILDDGYLRLYRVELLDDLKEHLANEPVLAEKVENSHYVRFFLSTDEISDSEVVAGNYWDKLKTLSYFINPKIVKFELAGFKTIGQFTEFMRLLGDKSIFNDVSLICETGKLDEFFYSIKE